MFENFFYLSFIIHRADCHEHTFVCVCACVCVNALPTHRVVLFLLIWNLVICKDRRNYICLRGFQFHLYFKMATVHFKAGTSHRRKRSFVILVAHRNRFRLQSRSLTGSIPGGGTQDSLSMVTVSSLKLVFKTPPALKDQIQNSFSHKHHRIYRKYGSLVN